ncbi:MAG: hypothetical protein HFH93_00245 [Lachnospiraceae bacterium]|nr:hypothetical protein [Lachnospiraceae bacterium]
MNGKKDMQTAERFSGRFWAYGEIYLVIQINAFLYYLSRLPVLGKIVHTSWYSRYRLKKIWSLFSLAFGFVKSALANNIGTFVLLYVVPHLFLAEEQVGTGVFLVLFILVKCLAGAIIECGLFKSSAEDYTFLTHFMVDPVSYYRYKAAKNAFFHCFMLFPVLYFLFCDWGMVGALVLFKLLCMLGGNVVYLSFYKRYGHLPEKRIRRIIAYSLILLAYVGVYLGLYGSIAISPVWQFAAGAVCGILAAACWGYHMRYSDYKKIAVKFASQSAITFRITVKSSTAGEEENGLLESGWEENREFFRAHEKETPERYLEQAFTRRFGRAIRKVRRDRILSMFFIGAVMGLGIRAGWLPVTSDTVLDYTPVLISFATSMAFGDRLMQMYFRNIDLHMLYHHMASPAFIRRSMLQRYLYLLKGDLVSSAVIVLHILFLLFLSGLSLPVSTVVKLAAVCIIFLVFWETYECIVYYLIQPYSVDMTAKSPVFKVLGYLEGIFQLLILFVRRDLTAALPWMCAVGVCAVAAFFVSRRFASRTFRLR